MKKVASRAAAVIIVTVLLLTGLAVYVIRLAADGGDWVSFPVNRHVYNNGVLARGKVLDRDGYVLADVTGDGQRIFSDSAWIRRAVLHTVGDAEGNIGTGLLSRYATKLMGYNIINGVFSMTDEGNDVYTTIDASVCGAALSALGERRGAVVIYNYKNGEIICMTSSPGFDPSRPPSPEELDPEDGAYINRALSSVYTPGSVFKVITLAAAIENIPDLFERSFSCDGSFEVSGEEITCVSAHGDMDIYDALAHSCNGVFSELALELGGDTIRRYAQKAGLLVRFNVDDIPVAAGRFDTAPDGSGDLAWSGIGQYNDLVNPLAMARVMAAAANSGRAADPHLVQKITTVSGVTAAVTGKGGSERLFKPSTANKLKEMLRYDVTEYYGDGSFPGLTMCAKSGTAEVGEDKMPHAWFTGFLDDAEHPYAFAVIVENGGWGVTAAGSVANAVLQEMVQKDYAA